MDESDLNRKLEDILDTFLQPIRSIIRGRIAIGRRGPKVLDEDRDETVIGENDSIDTRELQPVYYGDCGHNLRGNPSAQCSCGSVICTACLRRCRVCGKPLCPPCSAIDPITNHTVCHHCQDELTYQRRLNAVAQTGLSMFVDRSDGDNGRP